MASPHSPTRRPFRGSCHCGNTQYIVFLTLPHTPTPEPSTPGSTPDGRSHQRFYRCNCTPCHKAGFFHTRLPFAADDFLLLSPADPLTDLGDYRCNSGKIHWFFCKDCGVRCFLLMGSGERREVDLDEVGLKGKDGESLGKRTVWTPKVEGWGEGRGWGCYFSINAYTIDAHQEGFDLKKLTDDKAVEYLDVLPHPEECQKPTYHGPYEGGAY